MAAKRRRVQYRAPTRVVPLPAEKMSEVIALAKTQAIPPFLAGFDEVMTPDEVARALKRKKRSILDDHHLNRARLKNMPRATVRFDRTQVAAITMGFAVPASSALANRWTSWVFVHGAGPTSLTVSGTVLARFLRIRSLSALTAGRTRTPLAACIRRPRHRYSRAEVGAVMRALLVGAND